MLHFSPDFLHAFFNAGIRTRLDIMYIIFATYFYVYHAGDRNWTMPLALKLGGWTQKTTRCGFYGSLSSQARGLDATKLLDAISYEEWWQENFHTMCHEFWILNSKSWNLDSRLGAVGYVSLTAYFSNFWKIKTRRLKTDLTLSLILRFNLRFGGYTIWSASSSRTI
jgi:hypothetical protein